MDLSGKSLEERIGFHRNRILRGEEYGGQPLKDGETTDRGPESAELDGKLDKVRQELGDIPLDEIERLSAKVGETRHSLSTAISKDISRNQGINKRIEELEREISRLRRQRNLNMSAFSPEVDVCREENDAARIELDNSTASLKRTLENRGVDFDIALMFLPEEVRRTKTAREHRSQLDWFSNVNQTWKEWKSTLIAKGVLILKDPNEHKDTEIVNGDEAKELYKCLTKSIL